MRVAQRTISRNYLRTLNGALSKRAESFERGSTGLKFATLSENVSDGTRAMHVQEQRYQATQYLDNTNNLLYEMNSVDSNMGSIHSILQTAQEKVLKGMSESMGQDGRDVLAKEISKLKEEILQFANAQYGGKYLFSGTNNSAAPFTVNEDTGKLMYNGIEVEKIQKEDGEYFYMDENNQKVTIPKNDPIYADIGLGYRYDGNMTADPRTAFQVSFSGLDLLGFGTTTGENGAQVSGNLYDLLTEIENSLTPDLNKEALDDQYTQLVDLTDQVGVCRTDLGTRMNFLERNADRLQNDIDNLTEQESGLISSNPADEAIKLKECEYVWMAVLQLGSQILPSSLLDFMQ